MFALIKDGAVAKYPYSAPQLRADNPQTSFPVEMSDELLAEWGVFTVAAVERPQVDHTKNVVEGDPALIDGIWTQVWLVSDASADEIQQREDDMRAANKAEASRLLAETDYTQLPDAAAAIENDLEIAAYRAQLRAIAVNPPVVVNAWPNKPETVWK